MSDRDVAILRARDDHGYDWDEAYHFADGWYAAHAGWERRTPGPDNYGRISASKVAAYDHGFREGGGRPDDLFDAPRRANLAAMRRGNLPPPATKRIEARPLPNSWPQPTDAPRPTPWPRRLLILEECAEQITDRPLPALQMFDGEQFRALRTCPGHDTAAIAILTTRYGIIPGTAVVEPYVPLPAGNATNAVATDDTERMKLAAIVADRDVEDVLVAATDPYLSIVDAHAAAIPLCKTMERTRNTVILRRGHLRTWLARGVLPGQTMAAGHIRWGKVHAGLKGSLGEFTARYEGPLPRRGHAIVVQVDDGGEAVGYFDPSGNPIDPRITVSNKAHLRAAITSALRTFAGAIRLAA